MAVVTNVVTYAVLCRFSTVGRYGTNSILITNHYQRHTSSGLCHGCVDETAMECVSLSTSTLLHQKDPSIMQKLAVSWSCKKELGYSKAMPIKMISLQLVVSLRNREGFVDSLCLESPND